MTDHYKGARIEELLKELRHAESVFNNVDPQILEQDLRDKLIAGKAHVAITKAKLTALQYEFKNKDN